MAPGARRHVALNEAVEGNGRARKARGMNRLTEALGACWRRYRRASILTTLVLAATFAAPSLASANIVSYGGPVATKPHVYAIFWGSNWNNEPAAAERTKLENMYGDISNSGWQGTLTQYWSPEEPVHPEEATAFSFISPTLERSFYTDEHDGAAPTEVDAQKMKAEVRKAVEANKANGWPQQPTPADQFVVFPGPGSTYTSNYIKEYEKKGCAWHTYGYEGLGGPVVFDWIGWGRGKESVGESEGPYWYCHMPYAASHEYAEAVADPLLNGWGHGGAGVEVADLCDREGSVTLAPGIEVTK